MYGIGRSGWSTGSAWVSRFVIRHSSLAFVRAWVFRASSFPAAGPFHIRETLVEPLNQNSFMVGDAAGMVTWKHVLAQAACQVFPSSTGHGLIGRQFLGDEEGHETGVRFRVVRAVGPHVGRVSAERQVLRN